MCWHDWRSNGDLPYLDAWVNEHGMRMSQLYGYEVCAKCGAERKAYIGEVRCSGKASPDSSKESIIAKLEARIAELEKRLPEGKSGKSE